jgi:hypothetical protein
MSLIKRFRPSPAMVIGCLALLLTLGGTGYAASQALPRNSVTSVQVRAVPPPPPPPRSRRCRRPRRPARSSRPRRNRRHRRDQMGASPPRRRHRRSVRRYHARRQAERRDVHPRLRQRGHREGDPRVRRLCRRRRGPARGDDRRPVRWRHRRTNVHGVRLHEQRVRADPQQRWRSVRPLVLHRGLRLGAVCGHGSSRAVAATSATMAA